MKELFTRRFQVRAANTKFALSGCPSTSLRIKSRIDSATIAARLKSCPDEEECRVSETHPGHKKRAYGALNYKRRAQLEWLVHSKRNFEIG